MRYIIVESDNFGSDYPDEKKLALPLMFKHDADKVCTVINDHCSDKFARRYWKVVPEDYVLQPGFEP